MAGVLGGGRAELAQQGLGRVVQQGPGPGIDDQRRRIAVRPPHPTAGVTGGQASCQEGEKHIFLLFPPVLCLLPKKLVCCVVERFLLFLHFFCILFCM